MHQKKIGADQEKGFTLIEILLVIGIIAVLATVVIVALDPATRFQNARDARRLSDIQSVLSAIQQFIIDNKGTLPANLDTEEKQIGTASESCALCDGPCCASGDSCLDLSSDLQRYLRELPYDPELGTAERTRYTAQVDGNNIVTVRACDSDDATIDEVSR